MRSPSLILLYLVPLCAGLLPHVAPSAQAGDEELLAVAERARPSVARIIWRDERFSDLTMSRNAFVVRADGLLLMAGPPPSRRGTLTARFSDRSEVRARLVAWDTQTMLTLLQVNRTDLEPLELRVERGVAQSRPRKAAPPDPAGNPDPANKGTGAGKGEGKGKGANAPDGKGGTALQPLVAAEAPWGALPPLGLRVVMVTGDAAVAFGPVRAHGRHGMVTDPVTRKQLPTTGLLEVALAALDHDVGSPLLDADGKVAGLLVGRRAEITPGAAGRAARRALRLRPVPVEAVVLPPRVVGLVWPLLDRHRRVPRAALGVTTVPVSPSLVGHLRLEGGGHVIRSLVPAGAAERHGLQVHDVIVAVGGSPMGVGTSLHDALLPFRPGVTVKIEVKRAGRNVALEVRTGER